MNYIIVGMIAVLFISILNIVCFFLGAKVGQKVVNKEEVELPNPVKAIQETMREHEETKEAIKEKEYFETIGHNIDTYNGTSLGQLEIPK